MKSVRVALGAQSADVLKMVLLDGAKLTVLGMAIGLAASFGLAPAPAPSAGGGVDHSSSLSIQN